MKTIITITSPTDHVDSKNDPVMYSEVTTPSDSIRKYARQESKRKLYKDCIITLFIREQDYARDVPVDYSFEYYRNGLIFGSAKPMPLGKKEVTTDGGS